MLYFFNPQSYNINMTLVQQVGKRLNKQISKNNRLIEAAYQLFLEQGFDAVSIQEIVDRANVAKGTFYLYFRDKDDLRRCIITQKSNELFQRALNALYQTDILEFEDQIIFVIDYVTDVLAQNREALKLIEKDLSLGVFNQKIGEIFTEPNANIIQILTQGAERSGIRLKNPKVLLYMVVELTSATCFSCIMNSEPFELAVYKPYLFDAIRQLVRSQTID